MGGLIVFGRSRRSGGLQSKEQRMSAATKPIGIFYEHPQWFLPLFAKLEERNTPFLAIDATSHQFDPADPAERDLALVLNRMSPSAYRRGHGHGIFYTHQY